MIKKVRLVNFFSFKDTEIEFNPDQNILIGVNGVGKSNLLKAFKLLTTAAVGNSLSDLIINKWGKFDSVFFHQKADEYFFKMIFTFDCSILSQYGHEFENDINYMLEFRKTPSNLNYYLYEKAYQNDGSQFKDIFLEFENGKGKIQEQNVKFSDQLSGKIEPEINNDKYQRETYLSFINDSGKYPVLTSLKKAISDINLYDYFDTYPTSTIRYKNQTQIEDRLKFDGSNLTSLLNNLKINQRESYKEIKKLMNYININFTEIEFTNIDSSNNIEMTLEEESLNKPIGVTHISDGTLKFLCLLAIFCNKNRGKVVCIDEPENGLHPDMIQTIAQCIRDTSDETQYIISTHSPYLLDLFDLENILVFEKNDENSTIVNKFTEKEFEGWYDTFLPGNMWRDGAIGGNRW